MEFKRCANRRAAGFVAFLITEQGHRLVVQRTPGGLVAKGFGFSTTCCWACWLVLAVGTLLAHKGGNSAKKIPKSETVHTCCGFRTGQGCQLARCRWRFPGVDRGQLSGRNAGFQGEPAGCQRGVGIVVSKSWRPARPRSRLKLSLRLLFTVSANASAKSGPSDLARWPSPTSDASTLLCTSSRPPSCPP